MLVVALICAGAVIVVPSGPAIAAVAPPLAARVSVGATDSGASNAAPVFTDYTGRYVAFTSAAPLIYPDTNSGADAFLRDRLTNTLERVSLTNSGQQTTGSSTSQVCAISDNAQFIVFSSNSTNLVSSGVQLFIRNRSAGTTEMVSVSSGETPGNNGGTSGTGHCSVSDDGRYVAFVSLSSNLVTADLNNRYDVFVRDRTAGTTERVSVSSAEVESDDNSSEVSMSGNGSIVAFSSNANNLYAGDTNVFSQIYVRNRSAGTTELISVDSAEVPAPSSSQYPTVSDNGNDVAFSSRSPLAPGDTNGDNDAYLRHRATGTTVRVSLTPSDGQIVGDSSYPTVNDDGTAVAFRTAVNLTAGDGNAVQDIYLRRVDLGTTVLVSGSVLGGTANAPSGDQSISGSGGTVAFASTATNLVRGDTNGLNDAFVRDLSFDIAPFATVDALVSQQYIDFDGRPPTSSEAAEWRARLINGEYSVDSLIDLSAHTTVWSGKRAPVIRLYWAFFHRKPDLDGMNYWVRQLDSGRSLAWGASRYAGSSEFKTTYGALSNRAFVSLVYQNVFDRLADPGGLDYWTGKLDVGTKTRGDVMANFSESSEGKRRMAPQVDVILIWVGMLRTMPSESSFTTWVTLLAAGNPSELLAKGIRTGSPYAARV